MDNFFKNIKEHVIKYIITLFLTTILGLCTWKVVSQYEITQIQKELLETTQDVKELRVMILDNKGKITQIEIAPEKLKELESMLLDLAKGQVKLNTEMKFVIESVNRNTDAIRDLKRK